MNFFGFSPYFHCPCHRRRCCRRHRRRCCCLFVQIAYTHQAGIVGVEEEKRQHPPSEPKRRIVGRHVGVHIEAYPSTINVTEAIFDFPSQT